MFSIFKLGILFILIVIVLFVIFSNMFKLASFFKVLVISITVAILLFLTTVTILYINDIGYELLGTSKEYIIGEVVSIGNNELKVRIIEHNLDKALERNKIVILKIDNNTALRHQTRVLFEKSIERNEIKVGDKVNIICSDTKNDIIVQKVVVKY